MNDLIEKVKKDALEKFNISCSDRDIIVLDSSTICKFSNHLVFQKIIFSNNKSCQDYVEYLCGLNSIQRLSDVHANSDTKFIFDKSVYSINQNLRLMYSCKFGKNTPFLPVNENFANERDTFFLSLVCDKSLVVNTFNSDLTKSTNGEKSRIILNTPPDVSQNFPIVYSVIKSLIGTDGIIVKECFYKNNHTNKAKPNSLTIIL